MVTGRRLMFQRLWVRISAPNTVWAFLAFICCKNCNVFFKKMGPNPSSFFIFVLFSHRKDKYSTNLTIIEKSIDGMHGSQTQGGMMEGADESTEKL